MSRLVAMAVLLTALLAGCAPVRQIRVANVSQHDFTGVHVNGERYGDVAPGETTDYRDVRLKVRYTAMKLHVDGKYVTAQALNFGSKRYTYHIDVKDFAKGHLAIDIVKEADDAN